MAKEWMHYFRLISCLCIFLNMESNDGCMHTVHEDGFLAGPGVLPPGVLAPGSVPGLVPGFIPGVGPGLVPATTTAAVRTLLFMRLLY